MKMQRTMPEQHTMQEQYIADAMHHMDVGASHTVVGRTQRLMRERVRSNEMQKRSLRSLWLPLLVCSAMVMMIAHSAWALVEQWNVLIEDSAESFPANSTPLLILTLWFMPLTMGVLVMLWFQRGRKR